MYKIYIKNVYGNSFVPVPFPGRSVIVTLMVIVTVMFICIWLLKPRTVRERSRNDQKKLVMMREQNTKELLYLTHLRYLRVVKALPNTFNP